MNHQISQQHCYDEVCVNVRPSQVQRPCRHRRDQSCYIRIGICVLAKMCLPEMIAALLGQSNFKPVRYNIRELSLASTDLLFAAHTHTRTYDRA